MLFHAGSEEMEFPGISMGKYSKDFSWGFYCTKDFEQAKRWAGRHKKIPVINYYSYVENKGLHILKFEEMTDEWLDFIAKCRQGVLHNYDIVEGPMANDTVWNFVNDFIAGRISRKAFWALAEFKYPTHQISFHTLKALQCLRFERSEIIDD